MCPNPELISAFVDGEVPSPWKETLDRHLKVCSACAAKAESMRRLGSIFTADAKHDESSETAIRQHVFNRLQSNIRKTPVKPRFFDKKILIPLPLLAAAAVIFAVFGISLASSGRSNTELRMAVRKAMDATPVSTSGIGMESILEYLAKQDAGVNITITLPQGSAAFNPAGNPGEPFIVREADFKPAGSGK